MTVAVLEEPTRKQEAWRFVDTALLAKHPKSTVTHSALVPVLPPILEGMAGRLVFCDGIFNEALSDHQALQDFVRVKSWKDCSEAERSKAKANLSGPRQADWYASRHQDDSIFLIDLKKGESPAFEVLNYHEGEQSESLSSIFLNTLPCSQGEIVFRSFGPEGTYLANTEVGLHLDEGSSLKVVQYQDSSPSSIFMGSMSASLHRDASLNVQCLSKGAQLVRHRLQVDLKEPNAEVMLSGTGVVDTNESLHHLVLVNHLVEHCRSKQLFKVAMKGKGRSSFDGLIEVFKGADGTQADQLNRYLMLDEGARASAKPQLKIYADDVACAHGATMGQLDEDEKFYLASRGLKTELAECLLARGFMMEVIEDTPCLSSAKHWVDEVLNHRFPIV